jgi:hypothetical protein
MERKSGIRVTQDIDFALLTEPVAHDIARLIGKFPDVVLAAGNTLEPVFYYYFILFFILSFVFVFVFLFLFFFFFLFLFLFIFIFLFFFFSFSFLFLAHLSR